MVEILLICSGMPIFRSAKKCYELIVDEKDGILFGKMAFEEDNARMLNEIVAWGQCCDWVFLGRLASAKDEAIAKLSRTWRYLLGMILVVNRQEVYGPWHKVSLHWGRVEGTFSSKASGAHIAYGDDDDEGDINASSWMSYLVYLLIIYIF